MKNVVVVKNQISPSLKRIEEQLKTLPQLAYKEFVKATPVRSGNARRRTKLKNNTIEANYPYAKRLDEGYSKQSPEGMSKPTEDFIQKRTDKIMRK